MSITHLEVRRHPAWRDEVNAASQESGARQVLVLRHPGLVVPVVAVVVLLALLATAALMAR